MAGTNSTQARDQRSLSQNYPRNSRTPIARNECDFDGSKRYRKHENDTAPASSRRTQALRAKYVATYRTFRGCRQVTLRL